MVAAVTLVSTDDEVSFSNSNMGGKGLVFRATTLIPSLTPKGLMFGEKMWREKVNIQDIKFFVLLCR